MKRLEGKVALITGAGSGIGRAAAELFAAEGCRVVANDVKAEGVEATVEEIKRAGGEARAAVADVSDPAAVQALIRDTVGAYGKLDTIYNNAAIAPIGEDGVLVNVSEEAWERVLKINLGSVFLCCKYGIPAIAEAGGGSIINTASVAALMGHIGQAAYTASKGAIISLSRALAVECAPQNIRVNVLCPGVVHTGMTELLWSDMVPDEIRKGVEAGHLTRLGRPEDIARMALFLASDEAAFVTGAVIAIDGGLSANAALNLSLRQVGQY